MDCEMCGKAGANTVAKVEGTQMTLCAACARHGAIIRTIDQPARQQKRTPAPASARRESDLVESVHPHIARFLREHREKLGLTQEQLARKLSIRASVYAHYESGSTMPSIDTARALEHELHRPLVVKVRVGEVAHANAAGKRGLEIGDFLKRR